MARSVVVVGAGIGGLTASVALASEGVDVLLLERAPAVGGKVRQVMVDGRAIDAGPTVLTMRAVFDELFEAAGERLADHLVLVRETILARHAWSGGAGLDLFADRAASADAIGRFAGLAEARGFVAFSERAARIWRTLEPSFIRASRPSVLRLTARAGPVALAGISPFTTLADALAGHFRDPRLRQLFGRYATYCGSSPYEAPATLMLVAHLESEGVWRVEGGMHGLAVALHGLARRLGVVVRTGAEVTRIVVRGGRAAAVALSDGERIEAAAVIAAGDANAVATGLYGALRTGVRAVPAARRSLSVLTWAAVDAPEGFDLVHHNVFFGPDYPAEFAALRAGRLPPQPTVYVCAQDRGEGVHARGRERLLCLVNAPAGGDDTHASDEEMDRCRERTIARLRECGLRLGLEAAVSTGPQQWAALYPATGGALYGESARGWAASFRRPGSRTRLPGLYLAGGSTHPGPGVPMAALSGRLAASALMEDLASTRRPPATAMSGGISTRSARTAPTA